MSRKGTHPVKVAEIERLRIAAGMSVDSLAAASKMSSKNLSRILYKNQRPHLATIALIANVFGLSADALIDGTQHAAARRANESTVFTDEGCADRPNDPVTLNGTVTPTAPKMTIQIIVDGTFPESTINTVATSIRISLKRLAVLKGDVPIKVLELGSLKITFEVDEEDAKRIHAAFKDGRLDSLHIIGVVSALGEDKRTATTPFKTNTRFIQLLLGAGSIMCSAATLFPIWAVPVYITGLAMAIASGFLSFRAKASYVLPICGMVLNIVGLVLWPVAVGFYWNDDHLIFTIGTRRTAGQWELNRPATVLIGFERQTRKDDHLQLFVDGELKFSWKDSRDMPGGQTLAPTGFTIRAGRHQIVAHWNGKVVLSRELDLTPDREIWITIPNP